MLWIIAFVAYITIGSSFPVPCWTSSSCQYIPDFEFRGSKQPTGGSTKIDGVFKSPDDCAAACVSIHQVNCKGFVYSESGAEHICRVVVVNNPQLEDDSNWAYFVIKEEWADSPVFDYNIYQMIAINVLISGLVTTFVICCFMCILKYCGSKSKGYSKVNHVNDDMNDEEKE
eukprot:402990_1